MSLTKSAPEPQTDGNPDRFVVEMEAAGCNRQDMQPVAAVVG